MNQNHVDHMKIITHTLKQLPTAIIATIITMAVCGLFSFTPTFAAWSALVILCGFLCYLATKP